MRKPFIAGNWKMNLERKSALGLVAAVRDRVASREDIDVAVFPPFVYLDEVARALAGSPVRVGAQNCCDEASGAFTGEVSAAMILDVGADMVILGHSERRHVYGESDELVHRKVVTALEAGLDVILCVGETLEEREAGETLDKIHLQTRAALNGLAPDQVAGLVIAYEPIWAIGTGRTASPADAQEACASVRRLCRDMHGEDAAAAVRIQYGGSVKPDNAAEILGQPDVDGALVGGASLEADSFAAIVRPGGP